MTTTPGVSVAALLATLGDDDPNVRSEAAVALGERWTSDSDGLPPTPELWAEIARRDSANPGVADAFWVTVHYDFFATDDFDWNDVKQWMLGVLRNRRDRRQPLSPVPGNDLEFHAHDFFDKDFDALTALLDWRYVDVVELALDHGALNRDQTIPLLTALHEKGRPGCGRALAVSFGVLRDDVVSSWLAVNLRGVAMRMLTIDYGYNRRWSAHYLFPHPSPCTWSFPRDDLAPLLESLVEAGVPLEREEAELDVTQIGHIAFPDIPGTARCSYPLRRDLTLDVALVDADGTVAALRIVRARARDG